MLLAQLKETALDTRPESGVTIRMIGLLHPDPLHGLCGLGNESLPDASFGILGLCLEVNAMGAALTLCLSGESVRGFDQLHYNLLVPTPATLQLRC